MHFEMSDLAVFCPSQEAENGQFLSFASPVEQPFEQLIRSKTCPIETVPFR
jgi:hypothetical protein